MRSGLARWMALILLTGCSRRERGPGEEQFKRLEELTAKELSELNRRRNDHPSDLTEDEQAWLAVYDVTLAGVISAEARGLKPDTTKPSIVTRDYELWILPASDGNCFTVKDRTGKVLAERVDEAHLRVEFSYLHNLLHPEYLQFYDGVSD